MDGDGIAYEGATAWTHADLPVRCLHFYGRPFVSLLCQVSVLLTCEAIDGAIQCLPLRGAEGVGEVVVGDACEAFPLPDSVNGSVLYEHCSLSAPTSEEAVRETANKAGALICFPFLANEASKKALAL